jgi:DNA-binding transcriptional LysR family regulator
MEQVSMTASPRRRKRFRRAIRLSQLELLAAINHAATLGSAAKAAHITQPAASRLLRNLADELGVQLFERTGRTLRPTAAGRALLQRANAIVADIDRIDKELEAIDRGLAGRISVGSGIAACYVLTPTAVGLLLKEAPRVSVTVREGPMDELVAKLRDGTIDLMVGRLESSVATPDLVVEDLYDPAMTIVCGPRHPLATKRNLDWNDVLAQQWILPEAGTPMRSGIEAMFRRRKRWPRECLVESSSIQSNVALLNQRDLLWVLSEDVARYFEDMNQLKILPLPFMRGPSPFMMAHLQDRTPSPATAKLADALRQVARQISSSKRRRR